MTTQLRGEALKEVVRNTIRDLAKKTGKTDRIKINLSNVAEIVGTSRPTLYKIRDFIDDCIAEFKAERRIANGSSERNKLELKIHTMQATIDELTKELLGVRRHHAELYRRLYANSSDLEELVKPVLIKESTEAKTCVLCGLEVQPQGGPPTRPKVVKLAKPEKN